MTAKREPRMTAKSRKMWSRSKALWSRSKALWSRSLFMPAVNCLSLHYQSSRVLVLWVICLLFGQGWSRLVKVNFSYLDQPQALVITLLKVSWSGLVKVDLLKLVIYNNNGYI